MIQTIQEKMMALESENTELKAIAKNYKDLCNEGKMLLDRFMEDTKGLEDENKALIAKLKELGVTINRVPEWHEGG